MGWAGGGGDGDEEPAVRGQQKTRHGTLCSVQCRCAVHGNEGVQEMRRIHRVRRVAKGQLPAA